ncbi:MAG TPA: hypothetical protein VFX35_12435 [Solirubrobacterales bacterium]|nr:hypothetical protein [Solirubrobacterales bacterium]
METLVQPAEIKGLRASPADPVFFWVKEDRRRIVFAEWGQLKVLGRRVFRRYRGGQGHWNNLQTTLHKLETPGRPAAAVLGDHVLGYIKPWKLDEHELLPGSEPVLIARASRRGFYLMCPVLVPSVEQGRDLLRLLRDEHGAVPHEWQCYQGEYPDQPMDKLFLSGSSGVRTQLEHELTESFGPAGRARQALTRPDAALAS